MTSNWMSFPLLALLALAVPGVASAEDGQSEADVQCVVAALDMGSSSNAAAKALAPPALLYYIGRLEGRDPKFDLEARVTADLMKLTHPQRQAAWSRCAAEMSAKGKAISQLGKNLERKGL